MAIKEYVVFYYSYLKNNTNDGFFLFVDNVQCKEFKFKSLCEGGRAFK